MSKITIELLNVWALLENLSRDLVLRIRISFWKEIFSLLFFNIYSMKDKSKIYSLNNHLKMSWLKFQQFQRKYQRNLEFISTKIRSQGNGCHLRSNIVVLVWFPLWCLKMSMKNPLVNYWQSLKLSWSKSSIRFIKDMYNSSLITRDKIYSLVKKMKLSYL